MISCNFVRHSLPCMHCSWKAHKAETKIGGADRPIALRKGPCKRQLVRRGYFSHCDECASHSLCAQS
jgi:hypothetical protein